jgi:PilZ domain-containing protein
MVGGLAVLTRELPVRLLNCSASGCLLETNVPLDVSTVASLTLKLDGRHFTDDVLVTWCRPIAGGDARYHVGLRFVWTGAATPNTLRMMAHQLVAGVSESGEQLAPGGR